MVKGPYHSYNYYLSSVQYQFVLGGQKIGTIAQLYHMWYCRPSKTLGPCWYGLRGGFLSPSQHSQWFFCPYKPIPKFCAAQAISGDFFQNFFISALSVSSFLLDGVPKKMIDISQHTTSIAQFGKTDSIWFDSCTFSKVLQARVENWRTLNTCARRTLNNSCSLAPRALSLPITHIRLQFLHFSRKSVIFSSSFFLGNCPHIYYLKQKLCD